ncbi:MAG: hypothetical protein WC655_22385 [Candidatus Hydrogenedentales bacterium]|jgi:NAD(P)-dependent dehydrogenase (short-subunit alcohol dehydrogenase family)
MSELQGKKALITGASKGFIAGIATGLAAAGAAVNNGDSNEWHWVKALRPVIVRVAWVVWARNGPKIDSGPPPSRPKALRKQKWMTS